MGRMSGVLKPIVRAADGHGKLMLVRVVVQCFPLQNVLGPLLH